MSERSVRFSACQRAKLALVVSGLHIDQALALGFPLAFALAEKMFDWRGHGQAIAPCKAEKGAALLSTRREDVYVVQVHVNNASVISVAVNNGGHDWSPD